MMRLAAVMLAVSLMALACWRLSSMENELAQAQRIIGTLSVGIESRDKAIVRLSDEAREESKREAALRLLLGHASGVALTRELQIQRDTDASPTLRSWSAAALPDDVIRLHSRPAFSNARDYLDWLSTRNQLPGAGQSTADAGRSGRG